MRHFIEQQTTMYEDSKVHGDITFVIHDDQKETEFNSGRKKKEITDKRDEEGVLEIDDAENNEGDVEEHSDSQKQVVIKTYSSVLRAASTVFESMLMHDMKEKDSHKEFCKWMKKGSTKKN